MPRSIAIAFTLFLLSACGSTPGELLQRQPIYDETVEESQRDILTCVGTEYDAVSRVIGPTHGSSFFAGNRNLNPDGEYIVFSIRRSFIHIPETSKATGTPMWIAKFVAQGDKKTTVTLHAETYGGRINLESMAAVEVIRSCGGVYGTGYDRTIREKEPLLSKTVNAEREKLTACIAMETRRDLKGTAYLHVSESTLWVNSYYWGPTLNVWEARFRPEGDNATYVEVRSRTGDTSEGSLTGLLLENLEKCAANPG